MIKLVLYLMLAFALSADIIKHKVNNSNPTPVIREPLPNRIKRVIHRLPRRPMLEHRRLYRRLGILPEVTEYC